MISLDQVRLLESKVEKAVAKITALTADNAVLQKKNTELEQFIKLYEEDQMRIEEGIMNALNRLNGIEVAVTATSAGTQNISSGGSVGALHDMPSNGLGKSSQSIPPSSSVASVAHEIFQQVSDEQMSSSADPVKQTSETEKQLPPHDGQFDIF